MIEKKTKKRDRESREITSKERNNNEKRKEKNRTNKRKSKNINFLDQLLTDLSSGTQREQFWIISP